MKKLSNYVKKFCFYFLVGYPLLAITRLIPRKKNKWIIGNKNGFSCNSKYLFLDFMSLKQEDLNLFWLARDKNTVNEMHKLGFKNCQYIWSLKGIYHLLTAHVYISSYGAELDLSYWTIGRAKYVLLWHGVGIKNLRFKSTMPYFKNVIAAQHNMKRFLYLPYFKKPDVFLSTSEVMNKHFMDCFDLKKEAILEAYYPRCNVFSWTTDKLEKHIVNIESPKTKKMIDQIKMAKNTYIYMPTWRDKNINFFKSIGFDFAELNKLLIQKNGLFLIKLHPASAVSDLDHVQYSNIIILDNTMDLYSILPFTSVLITDYSSIYYDYLLLENKSTLLYPFDKEEYIKESRDLAFDYDEYTPSRKVYSFHALLQAIDNDDFSKNVDNQEIKEVFWSKKAQNTDLIQAIRQRTQ